MQTAVSAAHRQVVDAVDWDGRAPCGSPCNEESTPPLSSRRAARSILEDPPSPRQPKTSQVARIAARDTRAFGCHCSGAASIARL